MASGSQEVRLGCVKPSIHHFSLPSNATEPRPKLKSSQPPKTILAITTPFPFSELTVSLPPIASCCEIIVFYRYTPPVYTIRSRSGCFAAPSAHAISNPHNLHPPLHTRTSTKKNKMSLTNASHDSLPYIDRPLTPSTTSAATALIAAELSDTSIPHPSLPPLPSPNFTPFVQQELERISNSLPFTGGIDASRYEPQSLPSSPEEEEYKKLLQTSYTTTTHLQNRLTNLTLLSNFGQNAWLISNSQTEGVLAALENELVSLKEETEGLNRERKRKQVEVQPELEYLEKKWQEGIGRVLEIEVASEMVFRDTLERRRAGGV